MKFKKCPQICSDYNGNKLTPRCMNFHSEDDTCSGTWHFDCIPYTDLELKMLEVYWNCIK